jgi:hypothetical protein
MIAKNCYMMIKNNFDRGRCNSAVHLIPLEKMKLAHCGVCTEGACRGCVQRACTEGMYRGCVQRVCIEGVHRGHVQRVWEEGVRRGCE